MEYNNFSINDKLSAARFALMIGAMTSKPTDSAYDISRKAEFFVKWLEQNDDR